MMRYLHSWYLPKKGLKQLTCPVPSSVIHGRIKLHPHLSCSVSDAPVTSDVYASSKLFLTVDGKKFLVVLCVMERD